MYLADGGADTVENAIAVCPNCHRELHYGERRQNLLGQIYEGVERIVVGSLKGSGYADIQ